MARVPDADIAERAERVWDLLEQHPEGLKSSEICKTLGLKKSEFNTACRWLQRNLSDDRTQVLNYDPSTRRRSLAVDKQPTRATARWLMRHVRTRAKSLELFARIAHEQFGDDVFPKRLVRQVTRTKEDVDDALDALARASEAGN